MSHKAKRANVTGVADCSVCGTERTTFDGLVQAHHDGESEQGTLTSGDWCLGSDKPGVAHSERRQQSKGVGRRGYNFTIRLSERERVALAQKKATTGGPAGLGPWLVYRALNGEPPNGAQALPNQVEHPALVEALPELQTPIRRRIILDLCGGSGSWSQPYRDAGYDVRLVTLPDNDVRIYVPPENVWGVLAAPPCTEFSLAKNGKDRDFIDGMACVNACVRIITQCRPRWWALENPGSGYLSTFLGTPDDSWEPYEFGDPWTKLTAIWGEYEIPKRGPHVEPQGSAMDRSTAAARAVTPPGFARAFFEANP